MSARDWILLSPFVALAVFALLLVLLLSFGRARRASWLFASLGLLAAGACLPWAAGITPAQVTPLLVVDDYAIWFAGVILAAAFGVTLLARGYLRRRPDPPEELYLLILLATLGSLVLTASTHIASLFLGLEILSVSLYGMIGYLRGGTRSVEAAVKYLILAATASAVLLFGAALLYAEAGALSLPALATATRRGGALAATGGLLLFAGLAFKLALVPFHMWTPDVYQGAPAPVAAFIATVSKGAVAALALRFYAALTPASGGAVFWALAVVAGASMIAGNLLALLQRSVKRILAYSSIAHLGYLLVPILTASPLAVGYYVAAYAAATILAFGVVTIVSSRIETEEGSDADADSLDDYRGLMWRRPGLAFALALALLSLAGIPVTAGFMAKLYVFGAGLSSSMWALVLLVALTSAVGLFYYLRVLVVTFLDSAGESSPAARAPAPAVAVLALATLVTLWLGLYPRTVASYPEFVPATSRSSPPTRPEAGSSIGPLAPAGTVAAPFGDVHRR